MDWKRQTARDIVALGSIPFYALVLIRVLVGEKLHPFYALTYQLLLAAAIILLISFAVKKANSYASRSFALLVFTSLNYMDLYYTIFASLLWMLLLFSLNGLKEKKSDIVKGIIVGAFASAASYCIINMIL